MDQPRRKHLRRQREELAKLVNAWDPAGLLAAGAPADEYDCIVDSLFGLLVRSTPESQIAFQLSREVGEHFETSAPDVAAFAARAVRWFANASQQA
jgi:hypothetical protein